tara:strand:- start:1064 stop:1957 length:894 start_codon:yes stop_codon:yes gene_type:complete
MRIVELILDEAQSMMGIEAISIVENPAIEENFLALKSDEIKLAEVNKEKKILMGALLIPNKPIYRKAGKDEYYIYFSKDTVEKASQLYLKNGNQNNSTLEHKHELSGLTLVESWIVEDTKFDKSRKYGLDVPVGTWMGAVKVNNDDVWNEYVKTGKVKGFSIEGYFADKMERPQDNTTGLSEQEADLLLSQITSIVKGEKVELSLVDDLKSVLDVFEKKLNPSFKNLSKEKSKLRDLGEKAEQLLNKEEQNIAQKLKLIEKAANDLGIDVKSINDYQRVKALENIIPDMRIVFKSVQ